MTYAILHILFVVLFIYLSVNIAYLLIVSAAGILIKKKYPPVHAVKKKIAILIPSYDEDEVIVNTSKQAAAHDYPKESFNVFIAADHTRSETIDELKSLNISVYPVQFAKGSKARSLNFLLNRINENDYDIALVLDGDNIMAAGFLDKLNAAFQRGCGAVQGHRTAKNKNTAIAILDAVSEEINNHLFRRSQRALGFSSATIGSGMAFPFKKLKEVYNKPGILDNPACDREVDFEMMKAGIVVEYLNDAYLLDEKVSRNTVFKNQRRRWMESQLFHLRLFFNERVKNKTKDYWNKLFINLMPPRVMFLAIFILIFFISLLQYIFNTNSTGIPTSWWAILFIAYLTGMLISIPRSFFNLRTARALLHIHIIIFYYIKAALGIKTNRKEFIHTPKSFTEKSDPYTKE